MAYSPYSNTKVQIGREGTAGTAVPATSIWRGEFSMLEDTRERVIVEEQIGAFMQSERSYDGKLEAAWSQPSTPATYEQLAHIFEAGIKTATPSGTGPYVRVYNEPYTGTAVNTLKTYTIEAGSASVTADIYEGEFGFVESFELSGSGGEAWMMSSNWIFRQMLQTGFTAALTAPTVTEILFPHTVIYIDATGGTIGTTQKLAVLTKANINVTTGWMPVPVGDGNLYYADIKPTQPEITFGLTLELEDSSIVAAERAFYRSDTVRLFELLITDGTNILQLDWAGKYDTFEPYSNDNGNTTVAVTGHVVASAADSLSFTATLTNSVADLSA